MPIVLPNLDDRTWNDLVVEGNSLIPFYAPEWTDQNYSDPGITLMEQLASVTEMDIFQLNRLTDRARLKFLAMVGIRPKGPQPAATPLALSLSSGAATPLPAGVIFSGLDPLQVPTLFRSTAPLNIVPAKLAAIQIKDSNGFRDMTDRWTRGTPFGLFGDAPAPGVELYLGFDRTLNAAQPFSLYFALTGGHSGLDERRAILEEASLAKQVCTPVIPVCAGSASGTNTPSATPCPAALPPFAGVRLTWQALTASGWVTLTGSAVNDDTRSLTLDGTVTLTLPQDVAPQQLGRVAAPQSWVRVQFSAGAYDAPPTAQTIVMNGVQARQSAPVSSLAWTINPGVVASPPSPPTPVAAVNLQLDARGNISELRFDDTANGVPHLRVLSFTPATATSPGNISIEATSLGTGDGTPFQQFQIPQAPVEYRGLTIFSYEDGGLRLWRHRSDFDSSRPSGRAFVLDPTTGIVTFGDGNHGVAPASSALIFAAFVASRGDSGNVAAGIVKTLLDCPHNRALLPNFDDLAQRITVTNPLPATGGAAAETVDLAIGRAIEMLAEPQRAVTLQDYETLALATPGAVVARVKAWANTHPSFACVTALGMVTVVILPDMPGSRPMPSSALINAVASYLNRRRIIGSRLAVTGPTYREVAVQAQVKASAGASKTGVQTRVVNAINAFFSPLTGGPDGTGWPFGRSVYQTELMQIIEQVAGVDYISAFALLADGCTCSPQCGNICLAPGWLVAAGEHQIEVL